MTNLQIFTQELASRAKALKRLAEQQLSSEPDGALAALFKSFQYSDEAQFADAFAQTLTYGLLTARWLSMDEDIDECFTRHNAAKHLPQTSPFLIAFFRAAFTLGLGTKLDWLMDDIAGLLDRTDIKDVFSPENTTDETTGHDPVIHFYEPFLAAYDAKLRKSRGVYYTPQPVVSFIVSSVDEILRTEFKLADGLADTSTWADMQKTFPDLELPAHAKPDDFFVQILDPATGTGTFIVEVIDRIYITMCSKWAGLSDAGHDQQWTEYVAEYLLPRIYALEIMMAPYAVAHLKIGLKLKETGCTFPNGKRLNVFLTNALEGPNETWDV